MFSSCYFYHKVKDMKRRKNEKQYEIQREQVFAQVAKRSLKSYNNEENAACGENIEPESLSPSTLWEQQFNSEGIANPAFESVRL